MSSVTIYHNPTCGTSRNTLAMIRASGVEPQIIEYLKTPFNREKLGQLITQIGIAPRELLREKEAFYIDLGLNDLNISNDVLIDAMLQYPILINRPIVVTAKGARLCRPAELVVEILDSVNFGPFIKENGEIVNVPTL